MRFNKLSDWLSWQEQLHPATIELGLDRIRQVWTRLHDSQFDCPVISVAGTNGKGSSVAMLQAIYNEAGYQVGAYTSPHLWKYNERITINGQPVDDETICAAFERIEQARNDITLTYFEFGTLAALDIFKHTELDIIILEVGLGGRLDAVNLIDADFALITRIDLDHQQWLGTDRETIAIEKAGILRTGKTGVVSDPEVPSSLCKFAESIGADLRVIGKGFTYKSDNAQWEWHCGDFRRPGLPFPALNGKHQLQNAAGVIMVIELLRERLPVNQAQIRSGLLNARQPGRFTIIPGEPTIVLDVAHNPSAVNCLVETLKAYAQSGEVHAVFACLADKDVREIIQPMCKLVRLWYLGGLNVPRAADLSQIESILVDECPKVLCRTFSSVIEARNAACAAAHHGDLVLIFGSFYTVAQAMEEGL